MTATTFAERWRGLRGSAPETALLLHTSSVHGIGMNRNFHAVGLSGQYEVMGTQFVTPGQMVRFSKCDWVLELPELTSPPATGAVLELVDD